jgi:hypothetical protein
MVNREDLFIKAILAVAMSRAGRAETEVEVAPVAGARRIDVYSEPSPDLKDELADMGMLGELGAEPTCFEAFSETLGMREMRALLLKQHLWFHELTRRARDTEGQPPDEDLEPREPAPFPAVVILSPGKPKTVLQMYGFKRLRPGLYQGVAGLAMRIVVLAELPRTRATVLVRLGSKELREQAVEEILRMSPRAWERRIAVPILVQYDFIPGSGESPEETMLGTEILKRGEKIIQDAELRGELRGKLEGKLEGERRMLLKLLRLRFGELPQAAVARVDAAEIDELEQWGERVLTASSLDELLGAS